MSSTWNLHHHKVNAHVSYDLPKLSKSYVTIVWLFKGHTLGRMSQMLHFLFWWGLEAGCNILVMVSKLWWFHGPKNFHFSIWVINNNNASYFSKEIMCFVLGRWIFSFFQMIDSRQKTTFTHLFLGFSLGGWFNPSLICCWALLGWKKVFEFFLTFLGSKVGFFRATLWWDHTFCEWSVTHQNCCSFC